MAAKREISSTLRNLKFMQRGAAAQKVEEEKAKVEVQVQEEVAAAPSGGFSSSAQVARKCIVIMEGNPHPGAVKGRMSFQNFNPSIDKLNEEARGDRETESVSPSNHQDSANSSRGDEVSASRFRGFGIDSSESISLSELKRKQPELEMETPPSHNPQKTSVDGRSSSQSNGRGSNKSNKREKRELDFNHLRQKK
ncbi:unnamed protein product [Urochloa decumbens]|uniref:M-phase phosphoprotein 6 n=1 Tax=Urochloa decumbens TaxID=240449 RepID=A0ABC9AIG8_9POAL